MLLNGSDIPNLYPADEKAAVIEKIQAYVAKQNLQVRNKKSIIADCSLSMSSVIISCIVAHKDFFYQLILFLILVYIFNCFKPSL